MAEAEKGHFMYAHEISSGSIPEFAAKLHIPKFFVNNFRDLCTDGNNSLDYMIQKTHFPSIFFGAPGSSSPLHSDGAPLCALTQRHYTSTSSLLLQQRRHISACSVLLQ